MRKSTIFSLLQAVALSSITATTAAQTYVQPGQNRLDLGAGFDTIKGQARPRCVIHKAQPPSTTFQDTTYDLTRVRSVEEMERLLSVNAAAKLGGGLWSLNAAAHYLNSSTYRNLTVVFAVHVLVHNEDTQIASAQLTPEASTLLSKPIDFYKRCGDSYVSNLMTGGEFLAMFRYEATSEEDARQFAASIKFKSASGSNAGTEIEQSMKSLKQSDRLKVQILRKGTTDAIPDDDISALVAYAKAFPTKVSTASSHAYPVSFSVTPFSALGVPVPDPFMRNREFVLLRIGEAQDDVFDRIQSIQNILSRHQDYSFINKFLELDALNRARSSLDGYNDSLLTSAKSCLAPPERCSTTQIVPVPSVVLPATLSQAGGCTQWSADNKTCLRCRYTASQLGVSTIPERGSGMSAVCHNMPPGANVHMTIEGNVGCGFTNEFGNHCGDQNGRVDWWIIPSLDYEIDPKGPSKQGDKVQQANIRTSWATVSLAATDKVGPDGYVRATIHANHIQMWPNAHGPMTIHPNLALTFEAR